MTILDKVGVPVGKIGDSNGVPCSASSLPAVSIGGPVQVPATGLLEYCWCGLEVNPHNQIAPVVSPGQTGRGNETSSDPNPPEKIPVAPVAATTH